jgi:AbrB family looped-hinge helix DNA binding protein
MAVMSVSTGLVSSLLRVGAKGRVVLPVGVRRAAHIEEGAELIARVVGDGQLLLETKDAVRARVWDAAPEPTGLDAAADVRAIRNEDVALEAHNVDRQAAASEDRSEAHCHATGAALLADLGL